jgi:hypothetical protein
MLIIFRVFFVTFSKFFIIIDAKGATQKNKPESLKYSPLISPDPGISVNGILPTIKQYSPNGKNKKPKYLSLNSK